ncbi:Tex family protein [Tenacibaculum finnmarkense]|uniref:S1 RNA-binding domain-containing protein n=1 Tax=Tenacibaculum finnmarkense genomovar finnmarkense TaxID=1458503 RepID=A0AAP1RDA8_9FLAO|nr:Tex family protein [Tenacibaculum finnmarkense]MBE7652095.1 S1 RNA-binding domain-containing protein [Tenacibaculum finnmarkense genomovar finnmarkense]MBE7694190.1 S1 RNA-binding domain-containing protein [Tenacibaculum finnmarkense genomovar finnmarkense]MCD8426312.1 RNA-binding transcriptional accessory protein [Tenacibaculum finnmarkense genomovar finnmarkense]MCG8730104.1 RNA-binding transcriptional accessory protein [Tenacibaculum finnmarkense]MCG8751091.1 RNA-binding transcriptional 
MQLINYIISRCQISLKSIQSTIELLNEDCTIPFIARYRKEKTGNLDEVEIGLIVELKEQFEILEKRKKTIIKAIKEQDALTDELKNKIDKTENITDLEDMYLPYKKKRKTKAETARKNGLEPLAKMILSQRINDLEFTASKYKNNEVSSEEKALEGARHIISEWINERTDVRNNIRKELARFSVINTKVVKTKKEEENAQKFKDYFDWNESFNRIPSHRFLAILRAEKEGFIRIKIDIDNERAIQKIENSVIRSQNNCSQQIEIAIADAYKRLLLPALTNEAMVIAKEKADESAITVFTKNLQQLLLSAPLGEKRILAIDPGFRSGCKVVCLNKQGDLLQNDTIYPHAPQHKSDEAIQKISALAKKHNIEAIAIGNGTASRETEQFIKKIAFKNNISVFVISEAGASIYSASKIARDEFPDYDITVRGAISIGRRLADPLAELVKIDAKSIGVGQYQHDVEQGKLKKSLDIVVEHCVNKVGVNINTASVSLLSAVSGIGAKLAENIVNYRNENGAFKNRTAIKKVPRLGGKAFEQSAGFLRIKNGDNPLDNSAVHPECYSLVKQMAKDSGNKIIDLIGNNSVLKQLKLQQYITDSYGLPTLQDIVKELEKPGLDPREKAKEFSFNEHVKTIDDLKTAMILPGIINNITNFGCFVDIGIKESGLVHVSNLSNTFVKDINEHVTLNQHVQVKVLEVDVTRKRIQLSMNF